MRALKSGLAIMALVVPLIAVALIAAAPARAGTEDVGPGNYTFVPPAVVFIPPPGAGAKTMPPGTASPAGASGTAATGPGPGPLVSASMTRSVVSRIRDATLFCQGLAEGAYTVDCLSDRLYAVAASMPKTGDYADARYALWTAAEKLHKLATEYADPTMPRGVARSTAPGGGATDHRLIAVRKDALPEVTKKATAIIAEAQTILLRSGEKPDRRKAHFEQIAAAVGTADKVLLRSG